MHQPGPARGHLPVRHRDDTAKGLHLAGGPGAKLKEFVCRQTLKHLADEAREPGSLTWVEDDERQELLRARASGTEERVGT